MVELAEDEPTAAEILVHRISTGGLLVASDEAGSPVAFVMFREVDGCAYIEQTDVLPSHAGKRIGAALIDEVEERAREASWPALLLSTFKDVPWNAPYYRDALEPSGPLVSPRTAARPRVLLGRGRPAGEGYFGSFFARSVQEVFFASSPVQPRSKNWRAFAGSFCTPDCPV